MHSPESLRGIRDHATVLVQDITDFCKCNVCSWTIQVISGILLVDFMN